MPFPADRGQRTEDRWDWGLGVRDWGTGVWELQPPTPKTQSLIDGEEDFALAEHRRVADQPPHRVGEQRTAFDPLVDQPAGDEAHRHELVDAAVHEGRRDLRRPLAEDDCPPL